MSSIISLGSFILALLIYIAFMISIRKIANYGNRNTRIGSRFLSSVGILLVGQLWIHSTLLLIGGFFSLHLIVIWTSILIATSVIGIIPYMISKRYSQVLSMTEVVSFEYGFKHSMLSLLILIASIIGTIAFPWLSASYTSHKIQPARIHRLLC